MSKPERRTKKVTNIDRARVRASGKVGRTKAVTARRADRIFGGLVSLDIRPDHFDLDAIERDTPEFLKTREPDDRCEAYRVPPPFRQPDVSPAPSGILYPNGYKHRDYVPRDQTRTGWLLCILSGVVMGCIIAAVVS